MRGRICEFKLSLVLISIRRPRSEFLRLFYKKETPSGRPVGNIILKRKNERNKFAQLVKFAIIRQDFKQKRKIKNYMKLSSIFKNQIALILFVIFLSVLIVFLINNVDYIKENEGYYAFLGCFITLFGNFAAIYYTTKITNEHNNKLYRKEVFIKRKNELLIEVVEILINFHHKIDKDLGLFEFENNEPITLNMAKNFFVNNSDIKKTYQEIRAIHYKLLEIYKIDIECFKEAIAQCNYIIENYLTKNIYNLEATKIAYENISEYELKIYFANISQNFLASRNRIIELINYELEK